MKLIPYMCKLVVRSGFYEELSVPTPHLRNAHFFIMWLYKIGQKPKFRQCYFLGNIKNIKIYILGHILVPVSEDPGEAAGYRPVAARLLVSMCLLSVYFHLHRSILFSLEQSVQEWDGVVSLYLMCKFILNAASGGPYC